MIIEILVSIGNMPGGEGGGGDSRKMIRGLLGMMIFDIHHRMVGVGYMKINKI